MSFSFIDFLGHSPSIPMKRFEESPLIPLIVSTKKMNLSASNPPPVTLPARPWESPPSALSIWTFSFTSSAVAYVDCLAKSWHVVSYLLPLCSLVLRSVDDCILCKKSLSLRLQLLKKQHNLICRLIGLSDLFTNRGGNAPTTFAHAPTLGNSRSVAN